MTHDPLYTQLESDFEAQAVLARLGRGRDAAQTIGTLQEALGWARRPVEAAIQSLRLHGFPVASDGSGVWLGDRADLEQTIASLRGRLRHQYATVRAMQNTARRMAPVEQTTLGFDRAA